MNGKNAGKFGKIEGKVIYLKSALSASAKSNRDVWSKKDFEDMTKKAEEIEKMMEELFSDLLNE